MIRAVRSRSRRCIAVAFAAAVLLAAAPAAAQTPAADPADVESIDAIIHALYDVISGPAGPRDWDRMRSLFLPGAHLIPAAPRNDGELPILSVEDYVERVGPYFMENPFYEREADRRTERFGNVAHAFSTYESRRAPDDAAPFDRGINSIQLVKHDGRWWVAGIAWDVDRPGNPLR